MEPFFDPNEVMHRSVRRAFGDGIEEIYIGLFTMVMSAIYLVYVSRPHGSRGSDAIGVMATTLPYAVAMMLIAARKRLKAMYVFPRTGYVVFRNCAWQKRLVLGVGLATLALGVTATIWRSLLPSLASVSGLITSAMVAAILLWAGIAYQFPHLSSLAGLSLLVGSLTFVRGAGGAGALVVLLVMGSALAVAGAIRFGIFVTTHPVIEDQHV